MAGSKKVNKPNEVKKTEAPKVEPKVVMTLQQIRAQRVVDRMEERRLEKINKPMIMREARQAARQADLKKKAALRELKAQ